MGVEARKEPAEHDALALKYIGISLEGSMEIGIECLARGYAAAVGREDHGLPRREHRERVPHEGEAREGSDQVREEHREERVVLDEEPNSRDRGFRSAISPPRPGAGGGPRPYGSRRCGCRRGGLPPARRERGARRGSDSASLQRSRGCVRKRPPGSPFLRTSGSGWARRARPCPGAPRPSGSRGKCRSGESRRGARLAHSVTLGTAGGSTPRLPQASPAE